MNLTMNISFCFLIKLTFKVTSLGHNTVSMGYHCQMF